MRIHCLQHVAFEGPAALQPILEDAGHELSTCRLFDGEVVPDPDCFDGLIVMGGPMGVYDQDQYPWLKPEQDCIRRTIYADKPVLGICLGAQLIARALGATVRSGEGREIGWFPVECDPALSACWLGNLLPKTFTPLHWHGDRFEIPAGAISLGSSQACDRQGFLYRERVLALQFHLEITSESLAMLIKHCADELDGSRWVQSAQEMLSSPQRYPDTQVMLKRVVTRLFSDA